MRVWSCSLIRLLCLMLLVVGALSLGFYYRRTTNAPFYPSHFFLDVLVFKMLQSGQRRGLSSVLAAHLDNKVPLVRDLGRSQGMDISRSSPPGL